MIAGAASIVPADTERQEKVVLLKNPPFTWFDELTTGFDKPVPSKVEGLRTGPSKHEMPFLSRIENGVNKEGG